MQLLRLEQRLTGQKTARKLFLAHLELEHAHTRALLVALRLVLDARLGRVQRDIERESGLTHAGSGRDQDQVGLVQAGQRLIERMKAGGHARDVAVRLHALVQLGIEIRDNVFELGKALDLASLPDVVDALLGKLGNARGIALPGNGVLLNFAAGVGKLPQQALVAHDADVFRDVARAGRDVHELKQIGAAAGLVVVARARQLVEHGYRVDALRAVEHRINDLKDPLVLIGVEVVRAHLLDDLGDTVRIDQHRAEKRLLRGQVLRHLPH